MTLYTLFVSNLKEIDQDIYSNNLFLGKLMMRCTK